MPWVERRDRSQVIFSVFEDDDGVAYPEYHGLREYSSHLSNVRTMDVRPNDVFILGYPKSGNHWMFEITTMLLHAQTEYTNLTLGESTLDGCSPETIATMPSPRVIDSHLRSHLLPQQIIDRKSKLILVLRSPKDIVVSLYSFLSTIHICSPYHGTFEDFFDLYIHGQTVYGSWMEYIRNFDQFLKDNPQHPVHIVTFEGLKHDLLSEVRRLSEFLEVQLPESTLRNIADKTTFSNMSKALNSGKLEPMKKVFDEGAPGLFRKGIVGEWKNWLTIAQSEDFDARFRQMMEHSGLASRVLPYI